MKSCEIVGSRCFFEKGHIRPTYVSAVEKSIFGHSGPGPAPAPPRPAPPPKGQGRVRGRSGGGGGACCGKIPLARPVRAIRCQGVGRWWPPPPAGLTGRPGRLWRRVRPTCLLPLFRPARCSYGSIGWWLLCRSGAGPRSVLPIVRPSAPRPALATPAQGNPPLGRQPNRTRGHSCGGRLRGGRRGIGISRRCSSGRARPARRSFGTSR